MNNKNEELVFKVITIGQSDAGKTELIKEYMYKGFEPEKFVKNASSFKVKEVTLKNNKTIKLKMIDTAGREKFKSLIKTFYKNVNAVLFIFSLNNKSNFEYITEQIANFEENNNNNEILKYLVGTRCELKREVNQELIDELVKKTGYKYYPTSVADNIGIDSLFQDVAESIYKIYEKNPTDKKKKLTNMLRNKNQSEGEIFGDF